MKTLAEWEQFCAALNIEPERHRMTGNILLHEGIPISKGLLQLFAENDASRRGTEVEHELDHLLTCWENTEENRQ